MRKTYTVKATKTGREWKNCTAGLDMLDDNTMYCMTVNIDGFWNAVRMWWNFKRNRHGTFTKESEPN